MRHGFVLMFRKRRRGKRICQLEAAQRELFFKDHADNGINISVGNNFFANFGLTILDEAPVSFGDNVFIGPGCGFYTPCHPTDIEARNAMVQWAKPITVGNNVWIGGNCTILPGVTIGDGCTIGAGSVVVSDIPAGTVAVGNPCRPVKKL